MRIGIFDSGIGGLTVLSEAIETMPNETYIYFADTYHVPYGCKPKEEVKKLVVAVSEFLYSQKIDALVVACNTATSIGIQELRDKYSIPVIGMEPAVKMALKKDCTKKVLVFATALTIAEDKYRKLIASNQADLQVVSLAMPGLVSFAEQQDFDSEEVQQYIKKSIASFDLSEFGTLVLGCTHFIYFKKQIKDILPDHIEIVDGNAGTVRHLKNTITEKHNNKNALEIICYSSSGDGPIQADFTRYLTYLKKMKEKS